MLIDSDGLAAPAKIGIGDCQGAPVAGSWTTYSSPELMNATSSRPLLSATITGSEDGPASPESTCSGVWKRPPASTLTNTCGTPLTSLR